MSTDKKICVRCNELKDNFRVNVGVCRQCESVRTQERNFVLYGRRSGLNKVGTKWNEYRKNWYHKQKAELSDGYIISLFRKTYSREYLLENPHLIDEKRLKVIEKMKKKP